MSTEFAHVFGLGISEKIQLVEDLWDNIAATPDDVPVPEWQKAELDQRRAEYLENPGSGMTWEEAKAQIRNRDG